MTRSVWLLGAALIAGIALGKSAYAVEDPRAGRYDSRVRTVPYNPMNVVRVIGGPHRPVGPDLPVGSVVTLRARGPVFAWPAD